MRIQYSNSMIVESFH